MIDEKVNVACCFFRRQLVEEGSALIRISGWCMHPILKEGEKVRIVSKSISSLKKGDVVAICKNDRFYIHRIIKKTKNGLPVTKGDYSCLHDSIVGKDEYIGYWGRSLFGGFVATVSNIQSFFYLKYEKSNNEAFGGMFRSLIRLNMKINSLSLRLQRIFDYKVNHYYPKK